MAIDPVTGYVIGSAVSSLFGGIFGRSSAKKTKNAEEAFLKKKHEEYDLPSWMMSSDKLNADWRHKQDGINIAKYNEENLAIYKDKNARNQYNHALQIYDIQNERLDQQFAKSEDLYNKALGLNERSADAAKSDVARKWDETVQSFAYEDENLIIQNVLEAGQQRARGRAGVTAQKTQQARLMGSGTDQAINLQSLMSAGLQQDADLRDIQYQNDAADMQADARRMLKPIKGPEPIAPLKTPRGKFQNLRELDLFDYGMPPIMGAAMTQVPSWGSVLASAAGAGLSAYASYSPGQNSFKPPEKPVNYF